MIAEGHLLKHLVTPFSVIVVVDYILSTSREYRRLKQSKKDTEKIELGIRSSCSYIFCGSTGYANPDVNFGVLFHNRGILQPKR